MKAELLAVLVPAVGGLLLAGGGYAINKLRRTSPNQLVLGDREVGAGFLFGVTFIVAFTWLVASPSKTTNGVVTAGLWLALSGSAVVYTATAWIRIRLNIEKQGFTYRDIYGREHSTPWSSVEALDVRWYTRRLVVQVKDGRDILISPAVGKLDRFLAAAEEAGLPFAPGLAKAKARMPS